MNAKIKYLKDESGNIISPVTNSRSVFLNNKDLLSVIDLLTKPIYIYSNSSASVDNSITFNGNFTESPSKFTNCKLLLECRVGTASEDFLEFMYGPIKYVPNKKFTITTTGNITSGSFMVYSRYCQFTTTGINNVNNCMFNFNTNQTQYSATGMSNIAIKIVWAYPEITY